MTLVRSNQFPVKHPGLIFNERVLQQHNITQTEAALRLHMSRKQVSLFVNAKSDVSVSLAKKLEISTGISAGFWLNLQKAYDLYKARDQKVEAEPLYAFG
ncbi:HigA family addiction module antitoxin [Alteromonadaceae bacterium BrNp21-10]|nr:HigA family addiction module antitoxin [Alteromonadaceae bacterium BrNp21-10]